MARDRDRTKEGKPRKPRRPGGPRRMEAADFRTRRINLDVNGAEWADLSARAEAVKTPLRTFIREAALQRATAPIVAPLPTASDFDAAGLLTRIAGDLAKLAEAAAAGIVAGIAPELLSALSDAAHLLGLRRIGARAGVR